ncbi:bifunctional diaminohydroxyphosphoribosylaminopyrimidine deaminase/5-amino-6-(5-phosphoribosylamino)uracil reductase RibD [Nitrospira sp. M1]
MSQDTAYMKQALRLAEKAKGRTSPNPMVGAVVVQHGRVVGRGYHRQAGSPHAEILALKQAGPQARGATIYSTLEPCCHTSKRTPPCVPALRDAGVSRVVVAMKDPNPKVRGKGIRQLRRAGMAVDVGCMKEEAQDLNRVYLHWVRTGCPFVILKAAMTLDGKIATATGESQWITGKVARRHVHELRSHVDGIMVGIGTVIKDNPELSVRKSLAPKRTPDVRQPTRIVLDSRLRIPPKSKVLRWTLEQPTIVCTTSLASRAQKDLLKKAHATVLEFPQNNKHVSLTACFHTLGKLGITSVLVEGGSELNAAVLHAGLVNQVQFYMAPRVLGGQNAKGLIGGQSPTHLTQAFSIDELSVHKLGDDFVWIGHGIHSQSRKV